MTGKSKAGETRARILSAALDLFRSGGFEETTMREIADHAGMATGAAYYYFDSKDAIVLAFYEQAQREMEPAIEKALSSTKDLEGRLHALLEVKLAYFEPSRRLLGALAGHSNPEHPLSPFSEKTRSIRERDVAFFEPALLDSKVPQDLKPHLPRLLWLYQMGIILFWIYDHSDGQRKTRVLLDKSLHLIVQMVRISGLPLMKPLRRVVIDLVEAL